MIGSPGQMTNPAINLPAGRHEAPPWGCLFSSMAWRLSTRKPRFSVIFQDSASDRLVALHCSLWTVTGAALGDVAYTPPESTGQRNSPAQPHDALMWMIRKLAPRCRPDAEVDLLHNVVGGLLCCARVACGDSPHATSRTVILNWTFPTIAGPCRQPWSIQSL